MKKILSCLLTLIATQTYAHECVIADDQHIQQLINKRPSQAPSVQTHASYSYRVKLAAAVMKSFATQVFEQLKTNSIQSNSTYRAHGISIKRHFKKTYHGKTTETLTLICGNIFWKFNNGQWKSSPIAYREITKVYKVLKKQGFSAGKLEIVAASTAAYREAMHLINDMEVEGLAGHSRTGRSRVILRKL
ncbi:MAG: hypothetical protein HRT88_10505 [Lentisphaeraceae bacterium]|nr:hypothetical protein [Lentisphaeraceae bacterium]